MSVKKKISLRFWISLLGFIFLFIPEVHAEKKKDYSTVNKMLIRYNNYWDQAVTTDSTSIHLFDAFTIEGKKFNFKNIMNKKVIIITFSDDLHLKLTSFWMTKECDYITQHKSRIQFINVLQPTQTYYSLYKRGYEKALARHISTMTEGFLSPMGKNMKKEFSKLNIYWIFDYRLEITRAYKMKNQRGVFIYDLEGKLVNFLTGDESDLMDRFNASLKSVLKRYGYYLYEKD